MPASEYDLSYEELARMDHAEELSLERWKEQRICRRCVCYDGRVCDLAGEEKWPDDTCLKFEEWS
jgi:hypothetical protein